MKKLTANQIITILITLLTITVNVLANTLPLNGQETGEISDRFAIYFVPAGYVFSIWGLIYLGLMAFTIYQALPGQRDNHLLKKIYPAYWLANIANSAWIFLWHYELFPLTILAMITLLASLIYIYIQFSRPNVDLTKSEKLFVKLPVSVYLGWISVATIANFSQVLFFLEWDGWGIASTAWAAFMIMIAAILGLLMRLLENDTAFVLVLIWAFIGIAISQADAPLVANVAIVAASLLTLVVISMPFVKKVQTQKA